MTGYGAFGNAFANVPQEYQWILGLLSPFAKDLSLKPLITIVYKSACLGSTGAKSCKFPVIHYITTKHAVFLAIVVGNVSTPLTTYCIIGCPKITPCEKCLAPHAFSGAKFQV